MKKEIKIGDEVKSVVSGLKGIAVSRVEYINGCVQFGVKPRVGKDGKDTDCTYVDHKELEVVGKNVRPEASDTGGVQAYAPKH